jgi:glycosyltransferase involved in cell wall biosynthesis
MNKISVIIPVRNEAENIEQCLEAVFDQTKKPYEVIVVDGHSTDRTVENTDFSIL